MDATPSVTTAPAAPVAAYMNPYTDDVLGSALKNLDTIGKQRRNQIGTEAFQSGAYGDARHGIEDASLDKDLLSTAGDLTASIKGDAYDKGMGWLNTDIDRQTNTALANAGLDNDWFANQLSALGLGDSLRSSAISQGSNFANALLGLDTYDKNQTQQQDNADYSDWLDKQNWDSSKLSEFLSFIAGTPGQSGSTTSSSTTSPDNSWASLIGSSLANIFKQ